MQVWSSVCTHVLCPTDHTALSALIFISAHLSPQVFFSGATLLADARADAALAGFAPQLMGRGAVVNLGKMEVARLPLGFVHVAGGGGGARGCGGGPDEEDEEGMEGAAGEAGGSSGAEDSDRGDGRDGGGSDGSSDGNHGGEDAAEPTTMLIDDDDDF